MGASSSFIVNNIQTFGYPIIIIGEMLEGMGIPFPGEITLLAASIYASSSGKLNVVIVIILSTIGAYLGDNIGYWIGRKGGYKIIKRYGKFLRFTDERFEKMQRYFEQKGSLVVFT